MKIVVCTALHYQGSIAINFDHVLFMRPLFKDGRESGTEVKLGSGYSFDVVELMDEIIKELGDAHDN